MSYTCQSVRIPFNIPNGRASAFTTLKATADHKNQRIQFEKILAYTSCPQESVTFYEKLQLSREDALRECSEDKMCREFVESHINRGFSLGTS